MAPIFSLRMAARALDIVLELSRRFSVMQPSFFYYDGNIIIILLYSPFAGQFKAIHYGMNIYCVDGLSSKDTTPNLLTVNLTDFDGYNFYHICYGQEEINNMTCFNFSGKSESFTTFAYSVQNPDDAPTAFCNSERKLLWSLYVPIEGTGTLAIYLWLGLSRSYLHE